MPFSLDLQSEEPSPRGQEICEYLHNSLGGNSPILWHISSSWKCKYFLELPFPYNFDKTLFVVTWLACVSWSNSIWSDILLLYNSHIHYGHPIHFLSIYCYLHSIINILCYHLNYNYLQLHHLLLQLFLKFSSCLIPQFPLQYTSSLWLLPDCPCLDPAICRLLFSWNCNAYFLLLDYRHSLSDENFPYLATAHTRLWFICNLHAYFSL